MDFMEIWNTYVSGAFIFGFVILFILIYLRSHWGRRVKGNILAEVIPRAGEAYKELVPNNYDAWIDIPIKSKDKKKAKMRYPIGDNCTYTIAYPEGMPSILQVKAEKAVFSEKGFECISNRSDMPVSSPRALYNATNENASKIGVEVAEAIYGDKKIGEPIKAWVTYLFYVVVIGGLGYVGYLAYGLY